MNSVTKKELATKAVFQATLCRRECNISRIAPVDPIELSTECNCDVRFLSLPSLEGMYTPKPHGTIVIGSQRWAGRRNYTCAHELGHHRFNHGVKFDELDAFAQEPEEFLANTFASHLLMPQLAVINTLKERKWDVTKLTPQQAYILASYFGVGYSTIINHLNLSLNLITHMKVEELLQTVPKTIKEKYDTLPSQEIIFCDTFWMHRAINLEVGDKLILPKNINIDNSEQVTFTREKDQSYIWQALTPGYAHASAKDSDWAINIRVSRKNYEGLARYRFYKEIKEEN
jgi:Zn-dependent peptidase ImmA (M78 family)